MTMTLTYGCFTFWPGEAREVKTPNTIVTEGQQLILNMAFRSDNTVAQNGSFYLGLMGQVFLKTTNLAGVVGEPSGVGSYARQPIARTAAGWPTLETLGTLGHIRSAVVNFTASGADYSVSIYRAFLCTVLSGAGKLISVGAALSSPILVNSGTTLPIQYDLYLN